MYVLQYSVGLVLCLEAVLGMPTNPLVPSHHLSTTDKFEGWYNHEQKLVGRQFNSQHLSVGMLPYKRECLLELLTHWGIQNAM
jgi:hypothetical protein